MDFEGLHKTWERLGATEARWAILSDRPRGNRDADADAEERFWRSGVATVRWIGQHLEAVGMLPTFGCALDFGCGHGRLTQALADHFAEVVGVDIAESMLAVAAAKNRHGERVRYVHNVRADLSLFADASFDFVLSLLVLQHMRPQFASVYLREFARILRPGGVAFLQIPVESLAPPPVEGRVRTAAPAGRRSSLLQAGSSIQPTQIAMPAGAWTWVRVQVHNLGADTWHAEPGDGRIEIATRLQRPDGLAAGRIVWTALPHDVGPGESASAMVAVQAPATGNYLLTAVPAAERRWCAHAANVPGFCTVTATPSQAPPRTEPPAAPRYLAPDRKHDHDSGIEVHATPLAAVEAAFQAGGAEIVDATTDGWAGPGMLSMHFVVRKG